MSEKIETGGPAYPHTLRGHPIETGMSEKFTSEPWVVGNADGLLFGKKQGNGTEPIGFVFGPSLPERSEVGMRAIANARRIVACVNACDGISTDELEEISRTGGMLGPREDVARIAKQRDELLEALKTIARWDAHPFGYGVEHGSNGVRDFYRARAHAAILKATGE